MEGFRVLTGARDPLAELEDLCRRWEGHVLLVLSSEAGPMHFAALARAVTRRAGEWYSGAQLDALLKRMEVKGYIRRDQETPRQRRYQLTQVGREHAARLASLLHHLLTQQRDLQQHTQPDHQSDLSQTDTNAPWHIGSAL